MCIAGVDDFTQVDYVNNASVSVLWTGPNVKYYLKSDHEIIHLTGKINSHNKNNLGVKITMPIRCSNFDQKV